MEIKFKNKPSEELINQYCKKLEGLLSAHEISISINLWDIPLRFESYVNGKLTDIKNIWIKEVVVTSPGIGQLQVDLFNDGIDENTDERKLWHDAWFIQDQIYQKLNRTPLLPNDLDWKSDPYWKLWDHLKK